MLQYHRPNKQSTPNFDKKLLSITAIILIFGLIMLYSASGVYCYNTYGDSAYFIKNQLLGAVIGIFLGILCYKINYHFWQRWSIVFLFLSIFFLILVLIPGFAIAGDAKRWLDFGFVSFQPSELAKLSVIIYMSAWLSGSSGSTIADFKKGFLPFVFLLAVFAVLILQQPDLGTLIVISTISVSMYFLGGASLKHLLTLCGFGVAGVLVAIKAAPYRMNRLTVFLHPSTEIQGIGYHINQAIIAVGSGGLFGLGLGKSRQKYFYLPEVSSDSIFAIIAEELGFIFSILVVILFLYFFYRSFVISKQASDNFGKFLAIGIGTWICAQAFINIGAMLGVLPLTGITLPLMSYGRTSLIMTLASIGILLNVSKKC